MNFILIPGLWLDGSSWEKVVPVLQQAAHRTHPITLPGMASRDADRSEITLRDHVDAVIAAIDYVELPTGHWPQFTLPEELGRAILASTVANP
ncbi:MAG: hypothetical protein H0V49_10525 [Nocardioidaceae bacterium]|nr:hypothetical protein [Nocardioidaceae bacterium]